MSTSALTATNFSSCGYKLAAKPMVFSVFITTAFINFSCTRYSEYTKQDKHTTSNQQMGTLYFNLHPYPKLSMYGKCKCYELIVTTNYKNKTLLHRQRDSVFL
jgi:hypothetical protein